MYLVFPCPSFFIDSRNFDPSNFQNFNKLDVYSKNYEQYNM